MYWRFGEKEIKGWTALISQGEKQRIAEHKIFIANEVDYMLKKLNSNRSDRHTDMNLLIDCYCIFLINLLDKIIWTLENLNRISHHLRNMKSAEPLAVQLPCDVGGLLCSKNQCGFVLGSID